MKAMLTPQDKRRAAVVALLFTALFVAAVVALT